MTKKNEEKEVKKLVWKLKELPTADEIGRLVDTKVITPEEGRDILFRESKEDTDEVKALKEMVQTLKEAVEDLLDRPNVQLVPYTKVIEVPRRFRPYWEDNWTYTTTGSKLNMGSTSGSSGTTYTMSIG